MKKIFGARVLIVFTILCAVSGFLLRSAYHNNGSAIEQIAVSFGVVAVIVFVSLLLVKENAFEAMFRSSVPDFVFSVLGCILFSIGGVMRALSAEEDTFSRIVGVIAIIAAISLFISACLRLQSKSPKSFGYISVLLFFIIKLFYDFRHWMVDPAILDYCFLLFNSISFMLASFYAACFCYDHGKRRLLVIASLCGVFFGFACIPDLLFGELLLYIGSILWMLSCAWQALRDVE